MAVFFQGLELLVLRRRTKDLDPWQHPSEGHLYTFLCLAVTMAGLISILWPTTGSILFMWLGTWMIAVRWRGTFNGASDSMTFHILGAVLLGRLFPQWQNYSEIYIAFQVTLSYFVAGLSKLKTSDWRSGKALGHFLTLSNSVYAHKTLLQSAKSPMFLSLISWSVILFECLFPLVWLDPSVRPVVLGLGLAFHVMNFYAFGLNRFVFAWLAGYPALYAL